MSASNPEGRLFTIGHSNHPLDNFLFLLRSHNVTAIADVRSSPFSRYNPQYNREALVDALEDAGIRYVFLGDELGARREEPDCYKGGKAKYDLIAQAPLFRQGLDRVRRGMESFRLALLCAEKDPLDCHRTILICRNLRGDVGSIHHILEDGALESHAEAELRLLTLCGLPQQDLFRTPGELIDDAYDIQGDKIAYVASAENQEDLS